MSSRLPSSLLFSPLIPQPFPFPSFRSLSVCVSRTGGLVSTFQRFYSIYCPVPKRTDRDQWLQVWFHHRYVCIVVVYRLRPVRVQREVVVELPDVWGVRRVLARLWVLGFTPRGFPRQYLNGLRHVSGPRRIPYTVPNVRWLEPSVVVVYRPFTDGTRVGGTSPAILDSRPRDVPTPTSRVESVLTSTLESSHFGSTD